MESHFRLHLKQNHPHQRQFTCFISALDNNSKGQLDIMKKEKEKEMIKKLEKEVHFSFALINSIISI